MSGIYIHIPFCNEKCFYCDFFSGNQLYLMNDYIDSLVKEINFRSDYLCNNNINTLYFGGGTPSLLNIFQLDKILESLKNIYNFSNISEITIECNPENINKNYINDLYNLGINRISLGIQFLDNKVLSKYNRKHSKEQILYSLDIINSSNFKNLSVDLIFSVPEISDEFLFSSLENLLKFDIKHVSAYSLTVSNNTKLFWKVKKGEFITCNDQFFLDQYAIIQNYLLSNGFKQYEISNYAKPGFQSIHNLAYWKQIPYIGLGVSAHSYNLKSRQWNHSNIKKYIRDIKDNIYLFDIEQLTENQLYNEYIILKLRTFQGLSPVYIKNNFGKVIYHHFEKNIQFLRANDHFIFKNDFIFPKESDLLIADFLAKNLIF